MRSVLVIVWANLRRRPGQALLVAAVLLLSVLLFVIGVGLMREISGPFKTMFERLDGAHITIVFDTRIHDIDEVRRWWAARPEVERVGPAVPVVDLRESAYYQGRELSKFLLVSERPIDRDDGAYTVGALAGGLGDGPGHGEVWVSSALAEEGGIEVGETLEIPAAEGLSSLRVAAVVVDPQFSAPFNNPTRVWVAPGELPYYFESARLNEVIVEVRLRDPEPEDRLWSAFVADLGGAFTGSVRDYEAVESGYVAPYAVMAVMLVAFSLLSVLIALFAIYGTVTSSILADFRVIGIYRAQGFRPADVRRVYQIQYLFLALIAVPVGVILGVFAVRQSIRLLMSTLGDAGAGASLAGPGVLTFLLFVGLVHLFVGRVAKRAEEIRPAEAIRYGAEKSAAVAGSGFGIHRLGWLSVPLILALKSLMLQKRRAVLLASSVLFATLAASLAVNLDHSFVRMLDDLALFGFDSADVRVKRGGKRFGIRHERLMEAMNRREDVAAISTWDYIEGVVTDKEGNSHSITGTLIDGDIDGLGFLNLRGRHPVGAGELSLGVNTARAYDRDVGDRIDLHLMGTELSFEVTGVFQSVNNGGEGFRIRLETLRQVSPLYTPSQYGIVLAEGVDPDDFITALEGEYGEAVDAQPGDYFIRSMMDTIMFGMRMTNGFLALIFLLASAVFIFNSTLMTITENRQTFGILKAAGMTPRQLRSSVVYGIGLQAAVGIAAGIGLWLLAARASISTLFGGLGLVSFPLHNSVLGMALLAPLLFLFCLLCAWVPSSRLLRLDPKGLIVE